MRELGVGNPVPRSEDQHLLRGLGRYVGDVPFPDAAELYVVRSPHASARIRGIDPSAALEAPGVLAVLTARDALDAGVGAIASKVPHQRPDGSPHATTPYLPLASEVAPHLGDGVAAVVAETLYQARDAAERLAIDYDPLPSVTDTLDAGGPDAPRVWPHLGDNTCFLRELGNRRACDAAFASAHRVVRQRFVISRVSSASLEPRGAVGRYDLRTDTYELHSSLQMPHETGRDIAAAFGIAPSDIRVVSPDVGGGFGMKLPVYQEYMLVLLAAKRVGRPVRWLSDRSEAFQSDQQARDNVSDVELALDVEGTFLGLRVSTAANLGAYIGQWSLHVPTGNLGGLAGVYRIPAFDVSVRGVFSNSVPTGAFRGAGRPEASYCIERIIDCAAWEMGIDPAELRRRNLVGPRDMPYDTRLVFTYDCGDFPAVLEEALQRSDWAGFPARRAAARGRGRLRGVGLAYAIEIAGGPPGRAFDEFIEIRFDSGGKATVLAGSHSHGQGHETLYRQLAAEYLGLPFEDVRVICGDTDRVAHGRGTFGSRTVMAGGAAFHAAAGRIVAKAKHVASALLDAAHEDIDFADGVFSARGTNRTARIQDVARAAFNPFGLPVGVDVGLSASAATSDGGATFPNGCHVCEVEIDPETGAVRMVAYLVVEDIGTVVNPLLVKGQIHGGVAQGAGQALMEQMVYASGTGQLLTASFMDYAMPRAGDLGSFDVFSHPVPTKSNPLGAKGAGEAGAVGALPAVMNAVGDALRQAGIRHFDMPATPRRIWEALRAAGRDGMPQPGAGAMVP